MKKSIYPRLGAWTVGIFVTLFTAWYVGGPLIVSHLMTNALRGICETCDIHWDHLKVGLFPVRLTVTDIKIHWGETQTTQIEATIGIVKSDLVFSELLSRRIVLDKIEIENPKVVVVEGDLKTPNAASAQASQGLQILVREIALTAGDFVYQRVHVEKVGKKIGQVHLSKMSARAIPQSSTGWISMTEAVEVEVDAILEKSGKVDLKLSIPSLTTPNHVDISLLLSGFNLAEANAYLTESEGLILGGNLVHGRGSVALRGSHLSAWVHARYSDLHLKFLKMEDRGAFSAAASSILSRIKLHGDKPVEARSHPLKNVNLIREQEETVLSFILRGLKDAALMEATN